MRHCEECRFLGFSGYEYPESYCTIGIQEDDPKFDEDKDGCGCRYNIRTLKKMQQENDHAEYLYDLGYDDYMLMPTMEYTDENKEILEKHRDLIRHALGLDIKKPYMRHGKRFFKPYRNFFCTTEKTDDYSYWERMVKAGLAEKTGFPQLKAAIISFSVTRRGMDWLSLHDGVNIK